VIDNCEHLLLEVAEIVDRMLEASSTLSVVATSQSLLGVRGEHVWTVAPLSGSQGLPLDSVELFVDRARMVRADFTLTDDNETAVVEICRRLDHIPLAIELAAARVRGMTPSDISRRLDQRLQLLASSDRLAPGRHRTLDGAVRWSYELLDETQRRVFDRCSVFAGPFTIHAAETIISGQGVDAWEVLDGILALVDKSLVLADETSDVTRYYLLETMRQFGQANLSAAGTDANYRDRHADYYADYVLSRRPQLQGSGDQDALDEIEPELENIRVALRRAAADRTSSRFEELFGALFVLWIARNRSSEGTSWAMELTTRPDLDPAIRIRALGFAAAVASLHSLALARDLAQAADDLWGTTRAAPPLMAVSMLNLGAMMQGRTEEAIAGCDRVTALVPSEPASYIRAEALTRVLAVLATCGAVDRLEELQADLVTLAEELDNEYLKLAHGRALAPIIHVIDPDHAGEILRRTYEMDDAIGARLVRSSQAMFLALHELRSGTTATAARWASRSLQAAIDYTPTFVAQAIDAIVPTVKRHSPADAAILLGALRAHRARKQQAGTQAEIDAESRYETSLRGQLGAEFEALYAKGQALDEAAMITLAFSQLDAIIESSGEQAGS
jgi:predicted ATPase